MFFFNQGFESVLTVLNAHLTDHFNHPSSFYYSGESWELSSKAAFGLSKILSKPPHILAQEACLCFQDHPLVLQAQAVNGYINLVLYPHVWHGLLRDLLEKDKTYGRALPIGKTALIEYVSANPTGPLHAAHVRGAVLGDVMANMFEACGWDVIRAYFINDAGVQVDILGRSVLCHLKALKNNVPADIPADCYPAPYVQELAEKIMQEDPIDWTEKSIGEISRKAIAKLMDEIQHQMDSIGVHHTVFTSEAKLQKTKFFDQVIQRLKDQHVLSWQELEKPLGYDAKDWKKDSVLVLKKDQEIIGVLARSDDSWTYFAGDIVYHVLKASQCDLMITVLGADHISHTHKLKSSLDLLISTPFEVLEYQLVQFYDKEGKILKMSKRAGTFLTLEHVLSLMDKDSLRFMMLTKNPKTPLDVTMALLEKQDKENPCFYVQYAHARCCSVLRAARSLDPEILDSFEKIHFNVLEDLSLVLIQKLVQWPHFLHHATQMREPHRLVTFLQEVAHLFHCLWQSGATNPHRRFLQENKEVRGALVSLVYATSLVLNIGLSILGIKAKEEMH